MMTSRKAASDAALAEAAAAAAEEAAQIIGPRFRTVADRRVNVATSAQRAQEQRSTDARGGAAASAHKNALGLFFEVTHVSEPWRHSSRTLLGSCRLAAS